MNKIHIYLPATLRLTTTELLYLRKDISSGGSKNVGGEFIRRKSSGWGKQASQKSSTAKQQNWWEAQQKKKATDKEKWLEKKRNYKPQPVIPYAYLQEQQASQNPEESSPIQEQEPNISLKSDESAIASKEDTEEKVNLKSESETVLPDLDSEDSQEELDKKSIQTKLTVGKPGDKYELQADATAASIMAMSDETLQRQTSNEIEQSQGKDLTPNPSPLLERGEKQELGIQTKEKGENSKVAPSLESRLESSKGGGSPLPSNVSGFMEPRFGADFSDVRVHSDSRAIQMNKELGAQAFTHGNDIYYSAGKSPGNDELTAHELTHTIQQKGKVRLQRSPTAKQVEKDSQGVSANKEIIQLSGEKAPQEFIQAKQTGDNNSSIASPNISSPNIAVSNKDKTQTFGNEPHTEQLRAKQIDLGSGEAKVQNDSQVGNTSQATNQSQTPTEATTSKATSNAQTNTSMGIASGDKSTAPGTQKAAAISADSPGEILEELKNTRPTQVVGAYAQAQSASTQAFEHQKQQLQESIPQIPTPTGLPASESPQPQKAAEKVASQAAASKEIPEPQLGATKPTPKGLSNSGTKHNIPVPESPPAPPITATHLASQKAEGAQKGESDPALSKSAQNALAGIHLNSSRISTHVPQSPHVDMSGEADPSQMDLTTAQSTQQVRGGKNQAAQGIDRDFGESRISPQASNGVIKANKELSAIGGVGGKGGTNPLLTGEVAGSLEPIPQRKNWTRTGKISSW